MKIVKRVIISIVVIVILVIAFLFFISSRDMWFSKGRCLITKNNEYMLIMDKSPYRMSTSNKSMFKGLDNGDEIIALTGVFLDSYPGHVVMILDVCENEQGERAYLLAQGYMPAQEFHILKNPLHENDPWYYECEITYPLQTPEYTFPEGSLKRLNY